MNEHETGQIALDLDACFSWALVLFAVALACAVGGSLILVAFRVWGV